MNTYEMNLYENLVEYGIATPDEINLAHCVNGGLWRYSLETVLFVRTGYCTWEQYIECEFGEDE